MAGPNCVVTQFYSAITSYILATLGVEHSQFIADAKLVIFLFIWQELPAVQGILDAKLPYLGPYHGRAVIIFGPIQCHFTHS